MPTTIFAACVSTFAGVGSGVIGSAGGKQIKLGDLCEDLGDLEGAKSALDSAIAAFQAAGVEPGSYEWYCTVPGHKEAGMTGTVTVE